MAWNFLMKNRADTRINKNNTFNIIQHNTLAFEKLINAINSLTLIVESLEKRIEKMEENK